MDILYCSCRYFEDLNVVPVLVAPYKRTGTLVPVLQQPKKLDGWSIRSSFDRLTNLPNLFGNFGAILYMFGFRNLQTCYCKVPAALNISSYDAHVGLFECHLFYMMFMSP